MTGATSFGTGTARDHVLFDRAAIIAPQPFIRRRQDSPGSRLYDASAFIGLVLLFAGPIVLLSLGVSAFVSGTIGYIGIALFAGSIAARYGFVESPTQVFQLMKNIGVAAAVSSFFYIIFVLLYFLL